MADTAASRASVSTAGSATVRQRPGLLLMKVKLRATEATLELGLASLKKQRDATAQWLRRLGAIRVDAGEPHFADQTDKKPVVQAMAAARALTGRAGAKAANEQKREVIVVLTAAWDVAALSGEETLLLVDRLRFEAATESRAPAPEEPPTWASPEEQIRNMMAQIQAPPADDGAPQILFVARLTGEALEQAFGTALAVASANAERIARAAGMRAGELRSVHSTLNGMMTTRTDKIMERQRCGLLLAGCAHELGDDEIVSDDPRPAEFTITVNATFSLE
jgi:hypothetical protein